MTRRFSQKVTRRDKYLSGVVASALGLRKIDFGCAAPATAAASSRVFGASMAPTKNRLFKILKVLMMGVDSVRNFVGTIDIQMLRKQLLVLSNCGCCVAWLLEPSLLLFVRPLSLFVRVHARGD